MRYMPARASLSTRPQALLLGEFGERLRKARLRRRLSAAWVAQAAGVSRVTVHRAEAGAPAITVGTIVKIMGALDLAHDLALLARDDSTGHALQDARLPQRRVVNAAIAANAAHATNRPAAKPGAKPPGPVALARYPQLRQLAWHLGPDALELSATEAFALYERQWRHVDQAAMPAHERALVKRLTATLGHGVMLV